MRTRREGDAQRTNGAPRSGRVVGAWLTRHREGLAQISPPAAKPRSNPIYLKRSIDRSIDIENTRTKARRRSLARARAQYLKELEEAKLEFAAETEPLWKQMELAQKRAIDRFWRYATG